MFDTAHLSPFRLALVIVVAIAFAVVVVGCCWGGVKLLTTKAADGSPDKTARKLGWLLLAFGGLLIALFLSA